MQKVWQLLLLRALTLYYDKTPCVFVLCTLSVPRLGP